MLRAIHQIVCGKGKVIQPGEVFELRRGDFANAEEMESLIERGAISEVMEEEPVEPPKPPGPVEVTKPPKLAAPKPAEPQAPADPGTGGAG